MFKLNFKSCRYHPQNTYAYLETATILSELSDIYNVKIILEEPSDMAGLTPS